MKELTDKELIKSVVENQSQQHFSVLVERYSEQLYWSIRKVTKNHELTDDALQNTWIKVWNNLSSFKFDAAFYTWIYRIAVNTAIKYNLKLKKSNRKPAENFPTTTLEEKIALENRFEQMHRAIQQLKPPDRLLISLVLEDLSYKEIAEVLDSKVNLIGVRISRIKQRIIRTIGNLEQR